MHVSSLKYSLSLVLVMWMGCAVSGQDVVKDTVAKKELLNEKIKLEDNLQNWREKLNPLNNYRKRWMDYDATLPSVMPHQKPIYTLQVYKPTTPFDWDPVYKKRIIVDRERLLYKDMRLEEYVNLKVKDHTPSMNSHCIGPVEKGSPYNSGIDLMILFTKKFWSFKKNERIKKSAKELKNYDAVNPLHPKQKEEREVESEK